MKPLTLNQPSVLPNNIVQCEFLYAFLISGVDIKSDNVNVFSILYGHI